MNCDSSSTNPIIVFKRVKNSFKWEIDKETIKKIYEDVDDESMGNIEQALLSAEQYQKEFFKNE